MDDEQQGGFHPVNIGHLVMGVALVGLVGVWALWQGGAVADRDLRWLMPIPWVAAGLVGLGASAITGTRRYGTRQTGWVGPTPAETTSESATTTETEEQP